MAKKTKKLKHTPGNRKKRKEASGPPGASSQQSTLQEALFHHQAGRLPQAETLYRRILSAEPNHPDALHFLGMLVHQAGKSEIGVELIRKALSHMPDYVDAHYNLGIVLLAQGKFEDAVVSFQRTLALKPDFVEAYNNLGNALKDQGKLEEAVASFRQALTLKPDFALVHYNLGNTLRVQGKLDDAVASFRRALSLQPDYAEAHNNLGNAFNEQGRLDEAIASYRQALTVKPDFAEVHSNLGFIFIQLGKMDDAIAGFRKAIALQPDYAKAFNGLSRILKYTEIDEGVHAMEYLYNKKGDISDADRIDLGFALGKVFEDLGDYGKSFDFILEANRQKRKSYEYSIQSDRDLFEKIKKTFSPDFFATHQDTGNPDKTPIFILGMPRSGTTLVEQILASHPQVMGAGELDILGKLTKAICKEATAHLPECLLDLGREVFESMGSDYIEKIREFSKGAEYITDKMPHNFYYIGLIWSILPNAKVIHCMRNPMDNCLSIFKTDFKLIHPYAYNLTELGQYYNLYLDLMEHWEKVLPGFMYTLRYEEMVSKQLNQTKSLLDFCGLPWDEACLDFHKTERRVSTASLAQVRQPIYKDSVELWKRYEKQLETLRKEIYIIS